MSVGECIFCRIAAGEVPARKVWEDDQCVAFLDVAPLTPGHCLLVPRAHYPTLEELPAEVAGAVLGTLPRLGRAVKSVTGAAGFNVLINNGQVAGQEVLHVHVHVIPRYAGDGLGYRWQPQALDDATAESLREQIEARLRG